MKEREPIRLYVIEEQEVYRVAIQAAFASRSEYDLLGVSTLSEESIGHAMNGLNPDVLIVGAREKPY